MKNPFRVYATSLMVLAFGTTAAYNYTQQSDINFYQGHRLFTHGDYRSAESFLRKSLDVSPSRTDALREIGYCYLWTGRHAQAIDSFEKVVREGRPREQDKRALANAYAWSRKYGDAEKLLRELIASTDKAVYKRRLARIYVWTKKYAEAKTLLEEVLKQDPSDVKAKAILGAALLYSGESDQAIEVLEGALKEMKTQK